MNIVITGASRGIGLAEAKIFDKPANELALIASSRESFKDLFQHAALIDGDLASITGVDKIAKKIGDAMPIIDTLINNVGVFVLEKFEDYSEKKINQVLDLNLRANILLTKKLLPLIKKSHHPQIIFMSSMSAKSSIVGESVYGATKAGITAFAQVLRNELSGKVKVTVVHAWGVNTWGASEPNNLMKPQDVAAVVKFIVERPASIAVESIDLGNPKQWRGGTAPWSPQ